MEDNLTKISYLRDLSSQSPLSLEQGTLHALRRHVISLKVSAVNNTDCTQKLPVSTLLLREQKLTDHVMKYQWKWHLVTETDSAYRLEAGPTAWDAAGRPCSSIQSPLELQIWPIR